MNLVRHVFDIQAPPESVFPAITSVEGLSAWWTTDVRADDAEIGSLFRFTFRGAFAPELRITEFDPPTLVAWEGVRGHDAWGATTIRFRLDRTDTGTLVDFWHRMGPERSEEAVASANFVWGHYLDSLRLLCETGHGKPYRPGAAGARVGASTSA